MALKIGQAPEDGPSSAVGRPAISRRNTFMLPLGLVGPADVNRLVRECLTLSELLDAARRPAPPIASESALGQLLRQYRLSPASARDLEQVARRLDVLRQKAPLIHIAFGAEPSARFINSLLTWLRQELHPQLLLQIGLQPNMGAGCVVHTTNRYFDFSLRQRFDDRRAQLIAMIKEAPQSLPRYDKQGSESYERG